MTLLYKADTFNVACKDHGAPPAASICSSHLIRKGKIPSSSSHFYNIIPMQPQRVSAWRNDLPYPFNEPRPKARGQASEWHSEGSPVSRSSCLPPLRRANSADGALENADRTLSWLRYLRRCHDFIQLIHRNSALQKLRRYGIAIDL